VVEQRFRRVVSAAQQGQNLFLAGALLTLLFSVTTLPLAMAFEAVMVFRPSPISAMTQLSLHELEKLGGLETSGFGRHEAIYYRSLFHRSDFELPCYL
jgi:hypothetical protein